MRQSAELLANWGRNHRGSPASRIPFAAGTGDFAEVLRLWKEEGATEYQGATVTIDGLSFTPQATYSQLESLVAMEAAIIKRFKWALFLTAATIVASVTMLSLNPLLAPGLRYWALILGIVLTSASLASYWRVLSATLIGAASLGARQTTT